MNPTGVLLFRGQCWHVMPTLSLGEVRETNAKGVAFSSDKCLVLAFDMHKKMRFTYQYATFRQRKRNTYSVAFMRFLRPGFLTAFGTPAL